MKHFNPSIAQDAARIFNTKGDPLTDEVEALVAVVPVTPVCNIIGVTTGAATGASTVYTTPPDKDFYLVAATLMMNDNATSDNTETYMNVVINGATKQILDFRKLSLTAYAGEQSVSLSVPMKLDRNSTITINNSFTVGASTKAGTIIGYTVECTK